MTATPMQAEAPSREPSALIDHILLRFHEVHRQQLPELIRLAATVEAVHSDRADAPHGLTALLKFVHQELLQHMEKEECILFPLLRLGGAPFAVHPIGAMRREHEDHLQQLQHLMRLTSDATPPADACATWQRLCSRVGEFAADLQQHMQLENDVLFPQFEPCGV